MTEYVAGFMFNRDLDYSGNQGTKVALIRKNRPLWQAGKLNGIGGHVEHNESPESAIAREFYEETGYNTDVDSWRQFCILSGKGYKVYFYLSFGDLNLLKSTTDEEVVILPVDQVSISNPIPNLRWLIPMGLERFGYSTPYLVEDF